MSVDSFFQLISGSFTHISLIRFLCLVQNLLSCFVSKYVLQFINLLFNSLLSLGRSFIRSLVRIKNILHLASFLLKILFAFFVDFISEEFSGSLMDIFRWNVHVSVIVKIQVIFGFFCQILIQGILLSDRGHLGYNIDNFLWCTEYITDVLEKIIGHKSTIYHFRGLNLSWDGQYFGRIQSNHFPIFIFPDDREEIQQFLDVLFSGFCIAMTGGSVCRKVVGKLFIRNEGACGVKIKYIGILLAIEFQSVLE